MGSRVVAVCATVLIFAAGCRSGAAQRRHLSSPNPLERAKAVVQLAETGDRVAVHKLVELLEDPDRAVRMYTILALTRLCGRDYGYKYYKPEAERAAAVRRWRAALRNGEIVVRAVPPGPAAAIDQPDRAAVGGSPQGVSERKAPGP